MVDLAGLARRYRVPLEWVTAKHEAGICDLCGNPTANLNIDHDHSCCDKALACGECVRGAICTGCNNRLGRVERGYGTSKTAWLTLAEKYLGYKLDLEELALLPRRQLGAPRKDGLIERPPLVASPDRPSEPTRKRYRPDGPIRPDRSFKFNIGAYTPLDPAFEWKVFVENKGNTIRLEAVEKRGDAAHF